MSLPDRPIADRPPTLRAERVAAPIVPPVEVQPQSQDFLETMRKLWRHRYIVLVCTLIAGVIAALAAASLPTRYTAEARVLIGVPEVRVLNVEAVVGNLSPNAERVQNETFVMQSRLLAQQVIDRLNLAGNPEFNPEIREKSKWSRLFDPHTYLPAWLPWQPATAPPVVEDNPGERQRERMIDILLARVNVSTLGRSHVLSVLAEAQDASVAAAIANTLATAYLRQQKMDKIDASTQA
jgi:polysaccharide biosynthesis transport protein